VQHSTVTENDYEKLITSREKQKSCLD